MTSSDLKRFVEYLLQKKYIVYAPVKIEGRILISRIFSSNSFTLIKERPLYSFKQYLLPSSQIVFSQNKKDGIVLKEKYKNTHDEPKQVFLGITIYDLKAIALFSQVFEKDPYYQDMISKTIMIGQSPVPENPSFYNKYEENIIEHIKFDIFLESRFDEKDTRIFTGSKHGQRMLNEFGYHDFEHIEYAGAVPEEGLSEYHANLREKIIASQGNKIWNNLGKQCLGCNKCTIVCPTCFCFKLYDASTSLAADPDANEFTRYRKWDSCFNSEFSEISGGAKFLKSMRDRIYNWYDHKFVRIPAEYRLPGCVGCGRCSEVCPAGINIKEVIAKIQKINQPKIKNPSGKISKPKIRKKTSTRGVISGKLKINQSKSKKIRVKNIRTNTTGILRGKSKINL